MHLFCDAATLETNLSGRIIIVTGATSGHGKHLALQLVKQGAHVIAACRNLTAGGVLEARASGLSGKVQVMHCDVSSLASVRTFAATCNEQFKAIHCLVNNAGIMMGSNNTHSKTADGFEAQLGTNYLGPFLLTALLLPLLEASGGEGRVVNISSGNHDTFAGVRGHVALEDLHFDRRAYSGWQGYAQSKLCQVLHARELARRHPTVASVALHPGSICTNVTRHMLPFWLRVCTIPLERCLVGQVSSWVGIQTALHCTVSSKDTLENGAYYSQRQSPWGVKGGWPVKSGNPEAVDDALAGKLWEVSEKLVGLG